MKVQTLAEGAATPEDAIKFEGSTVKRRTIVPDKIGTATCESPLTPEFRATYNHGD